MNTNQDQELVVCEEEVVEPVSKKEKVKKFFKRAAIGTLAVIGGIKVLGTIFGRSKDDTTYDSDVCEPETSVCDDAE